MGCTSSGEADQRGGGTKRNQYASAEQTEVVALKKNETAALEKGELLIEDDQFKGVFYKVNTITKTCECNESKNRPDVQSAWCR